MYIGNASYENKYTQRTYKGKEKKIDMSLISIFISKFLFFCGIFLKVVLFFLFSSLVGWRRMEVNDVTA